ncbi:hypothetical protein Rhal01_01758 [Rubritalea halochordaticola]|uniref:PEP-CTERM sorting domain-containing protein n=1 Tax=Rubritalea halochordaticola TaxID=714537 RepID=A0ABP9V0Z3_9BACT
MKITQWICITAILPSITQHQSEAAVVITGFERTHSAEIIKNSKTKSSLQISTPISPFTDETGNTTQGASKAEYSLSYSPDSGALDSLTPPGSSTGAKLNWVSQSTVIQGGNADYSYMHSELSFKLSVSGDPVILRLDKSQVAGSTTDGTSFTIFDGSGEQVLHQFNSNAFSTLLSPGEYLISFQNHVSATERVTVSSHYNLTLEIEPSSTISSPEIPEPTPALMLGLAGTTFLLIRKKA